MEQITLVVGLGNPGSEYAQTRHNAGFWFADALCEAWGGRFTANRKLRSEQADIRIEDSTVRILKPQTWMNLSGEAVGPALRYFKIPAPAMLVAYDEIDLDLGRIRLKFDGGHAGHNGVRNIIQHVGREFWRLRLGVGHPGRSSQVKGHVLRRAAPEHEQLIRDAISRSVDVFPMLLRDGAQQAQQRLHTENADGH